VAIYPPETSESLMQKAEHARRLAALLPPGEAAERLLEYAKELEAQAAILGDETSEV
jgi:hypothetical protein